MDGIFERLKRRKIVQWALAYLAASFALIQVFDIVAQRFGWPELAVRFVIIALAIGFFVALVLSWYHGEIGTQRVSGTELLILALLLSIGGGLLWRQSQRAPESMEAKSTSSTAGTKPASPIPEKSIAVLPFDNLSDDKANAYFAEGIQDEILTRLSGIADLKVISRTSTKHYASRPADLRTVAAELGVAHILEGSVQKAGESVRVNVQLINARDDTHLWARTFDRELKNVFVVESEVAQQIADVLKVQLSPRESQALAMKATENAMAYDHFLRAEFQVHRTYASKEDADYNAADQEFAQAITLDPDFAMAYARRAYNQLSRHWRNRRLSVAELDEVKGWIERALQLAPELPAAHAALGYFHYWGFRHYDAATAEFERTLQLAPNYIDALSGIAAIQRRRGKSSEALESLRRAMTLSPRDSLLSSEIGTTLTKLRRYAEAESELRRTLELDPGDTNARDYLMRIRLFGYGDVAGARAALDPPPAWRIPYHNILAGDLLDLVNVRVYPDLFERRFDAALRQWDTAPHDSPEEQLTQRVARVAIRIIANDRKSLQAECTALASLLHERAKEQPDSLSVLQQLSWVELCHGNNVEAIAAARHAAEVLPIEADAYFGVYQVEGLAEISARAGASDEALKLLDQLLSLPTGESITVERLQRDPLWDPLRNDSRFLELTSHGDAAVQAQGKH